MAGSGVFRDLLFSENNPEQIECDVAIIGGGVGGVAAAIAALRKRPECGPDRGN